MALRRGFIWEKVHGNNVKHSSFDLSNENKLSFEIGDLVPVYTREVVPGDKFAMANSHFIRFAPLTFPVMHRFDVRFHWFYVPYRILWPNWEKFRSHGDGNVLMKDQPGWTPPEVPYMEMRDFIDVGDVFPGSLCDYLGYQIQNNNSRVKLNLFRLAAYQRIWSDWYRNEALQAVPQFYANDDSLELRDGDFFSIDEHPRSDLVTLRKVNYEKDYFTSALPSPQLGGDVMLPLNGTAPVDFELTNNSSVQHTFNSTFGNLGIYRSQARLNPGETASTRSLLTSDDESKPLLNTISVHANADLSQATASTISDLRRAFSLQRYQELLARAGTRYKEWIGAIFNEPTRDGRLDRSEYLGGYSRPVTITDVVSTAQTDADPLGAQAGYATSSGSGKYINYNVPEDGLIMCCMSLLPRTGYGQMIDRTLLSTSPYDFFNPMFENIGEQEVYNCEVFAGSNDPKGVFGYNPRFSEHKYSSDEVHGDFAPGGNLEDFTAVRSFSSQPNLNDSFVKVNEVNRIFAYQGDDYKHLYAQVFNYVKASRPMSKYGNPW